MATPPPVGDAHGAIARCSFSVLLPVTYQVIPPASVATPTAPTIQPMFAVAIALRAVEIDGSPGGAAHWCVEIEQLPGTRETSNRPNAVPPSAIAPPPMIRIFEPVGCVVFGALGLGGAATATS